MQFDQLNRRDFIVLLAGGSAGWPLVANAQQSEKLFRIGYLAFLRGEDSDTVLQRLSELGYSEGQNLRFDVRSADGQAERLPQLAAGVGSNSSGRLDCRIRDAAREGGEGCNHNNPCRLYKRRRSYRRGRGCEPELTGRKCHGREQ